MEASVSMALITMVKPATLSVHRLVSTFMVKSVVKMMKKRIVEKYNVNTLTLSQISTNVPAGSAPIRPNVSMASITMAYTVMSSVPQIAWVLMVRLVSLRLKSKMMIRKKKMTEKIYSANTLVQPLVQILKRTKDGSAKTVASVSMALIIMANSVIFFVPQIT